MIKILPAVPRLSICLLLATFIGAPLCQGIPPSASWTRSWYDEFNGTSINTTLWSTGSYPWASRIVNDQYSSYGANADSYLENGSLVLRCRASNGASEFGGYPYSQGIVHSGYTKGRWLYGYLEIRAKYPGGNRVWPAFWMLGDAWPPEFDIAEYFGSEERMHMGLAYGSGAGTWDSSNFYNSSESFEGNWHSYALEWGPGYARWFKDGALKKSIYGSQVPAQSMYVLLNSGIRNISGTPTTPNYFYVDYFRKFNPPAAVINDGTTGTGVNQCRYVGTWSYSSSQTGAFFNDWHYSNTANSYVEIAFNGTRVDYYGAKSASQGIGAFSIDGGPETLVDCYATTRQETQLLWTASGLSGGAHTLKVRMTGTKNASSTNTYINADRIDIWTTASSLPGTLIGTTGSYQSAGNTRDKGADGDLRTYIDGPTPNGNWVGRDLGTTPKRITKVVYSPRSTYASRMVGGRFQGANAADFSDAVDLFTITAAPDDGAMTTQAISNTSGFRYVRYLSPDASQGNVAEIEFYGTDVGANNGTWVSNSDGAWSDTTKWSAGTIASGAGFTADFNTLNLSASRTVSLDSSRVIGTLKFGDTAGAESWTLGSSEGEVLTLDTGGATVPTIAVNQNTATISASLDGSNGFVKDGAGRLVLSGNNALNGTLYIDGNSTTDSDGIVCIANSDAIAQVSSPIPIRNNNNGSSTLQLDGTAGDVEIAQDITLAGRNVSPPAIQNLAGANTISGDITTNVGGTSFTMQSDAGTLTFTGAISTSTNNARTFTFQGNGDILVNGVIGNGSGSVAISKVGPGKLKLNGANTYTGGTTLTAGSLVVNGSLASGSTLTTASGTFLAGTGAIATVTTVNGTHSPGATIGTQTFSGQLSYGATARLAWQLAGNTVTAGGFDRVSAGLVTIANGAAVDVVLNAEETSVALTDPFWTQTRSWTVLTGTNVIGTFALGNVTVDASGRNASNYGTFSLQKTSTAVTLTFTPFTPSQSWQHVNFGADWNTPSIAGDSVDVDGDGLPNLLEYALGTDPKVADFTASPRVATVGGKLTMTFVRNSAATDLTLSVVGSDKISGPWTEIARSTGGAAFTATAPDVTATEDGEGLTRTVEVRDAYLTTDPAHPHRFLRLKVQN